MIPYAGGYDREEGETLDTSDYGKGGKVRWQDRLLLDRPSKVLTVLIILAVVIPLLLYQFIYFASKDPQPDDGFSIGSCMLRREDRVPCGVEDVNHTECNPACCYDYQSNKCYHRLPSRFTFISDSNWSEETVFRPRNEETPFKNKSSLLRTRLSFDELSKSHLAITFYNADELNLNGTRLEEKDYTYKVNQKELSIEVIGPNGFVFNNARGPIVAADNIWEMFISLTNETIYGLGEIPLTDGMVKVLYSHDTIVFSVPLIFAKMGKAYHGLLIDTTAPTEVRVIGNNRVHIRSITNLGLKFHVFIGPTPKDVMKDVIKLIGTKKINYWMLGAHFCSSISKEPTEIYNEVVQFISDASTNNLPYESLCGVSPLLFEDQCDNDLVTIANRAATFIKNSRKKYIPHVTPYVHYEEVIVDNNEKEDFETDLQRDADIDDNDGLCSLANDFGDNMVRDQNLDIYHGKVGAVNVIYPDYSNVTEEIMQRLWVFQEADGFILEDSWPLDESVEFLNETYQYLPYFSEAFETAFQDTPQWNATYTNGNKYIYTHNEYGQNFATAMKNISNAESPIWSTSQRMSGEVGVNRQNVDTSWTNFRNELLEAALGGISGQWLWSSPICGDTDNYNATIHESLCLKWYMAATYLPMIKVHSKKNRRDPMAFEGTYKKLMIDAFQKRLSFLPYFYTTLQEGPLLRPMFYQFPISAAIADLKSQFSVGDHLLIVPNLIPNLPVVHLWLPPGNWYEFWSGLKIDGKEGDAITMTTVESDFITLVQGGSVIVTQMNTRLTAAETRLNSDFTITVALHCETIITTDEFDLITQLTTEVCHASGSLYVSGNMTVNFEADIKQLSIKVAGDEFEGMCSTTPFTARRIETVKVYGLPRDLNNFDNIRLLNVAIDLCNLQEENVINIPYVS